MTDALNDTGDSPKKPRPPRKKSIKIDGVGAGALSLLKKLAWKKGSSRLRARRIFPHPFQYHVVDDRGVYEEERVTDGMVASPVAARCISASEIELTTDEIWYSVTKYGRMVAESRVPPTTVGQVDIFGSEP